jgi:hypothetical protein
MFDFVVICSILAFNFSVSCHFDSTMVTSLMIHLFTFFKLIKGFSHITFLLAKTMIHHFLLQDMQHSEVFPKCYELSLSDFVLSILLIWDR